MITHKTFRSPDLEEIKAVAQEKLVELKSGPPKNLREHMWNIEYKSYQSLDDLSVEIAYGMRAEEGDDYISIWAHLGPTRVFLAAEWPESWMDEIAAGVFDRLLFLQEVPDPLRAIAAVESVTQDDLDELQKWVDRDFALSGKLSDEYRLGELLLKFKREYPKGCITVTVDLGWGGVAIFGERNVVVLDMRETVTRIKEVAMAQFSEWNIES